jgi:hypothetical protein
MGPACLITLHQQTKLVLTARAISSCRRGTRTAHGAVSYSTNPGGQPQSPLQAALCCVYPLSPPPRQEGTSANFDILQCEEKSQEDRRVTPLDQLDNTKIV